MPRLLLICDNFPPNFAPRMGNLCKYLPELGWEIDVITEECENYKQCNIDIDSDKVKVNRIKYYKSASKLEYWVKYALNIICEHKDNYFYKASKSVLMNKQYDCVLCSTYHIFPLRFAELIATNLNLQLYVDLRDIIEQHPCGTKQRIMQFLKGWGVHKRRRNKILANANGVISVSPWHVKTLSKINPLTHLIYNGYDAEIFTPQDVVNDTFKIVYTGRIHYPHTQNPEMFFEAISSLMKSQQLERLSLDWYVDEVSERTVKMFAQKYDVDSITHCKAMINSQHIPEVLRNGAVSLVLANKSDKNGPKGILTTKFFEALGTEKPVLCVPSDEADLANAIKKTNAGIAAKNTKEIEEFILEKYAEWQQNGFTRQAVSQEQKAQFTRQKQAEQFLAILKGKSNQAVE